MLIIPLGREDDAIQRYAWVTYALIALNILAFLFICVGASDEQEMALIGKWRDTVAYLRERPYLSVPPRIADLMPRDLQQRTPVADPDVPSWRASNEQGEAIEMAGELRGLYETTSSLRLAYIPAVGGWFTILTSMFLHAGLFHIAGNMLFLFAMGPLVEDELGRILYAALYLTGGIVATLAFAARFPDAITPLVGASGAISAVMGAYLVRFALARMRFMVIPILILPFWNFRFSLPALIVLPIWFLEQLVSIPAELDSGVAVTAHVAGFVYGAVLAAMIRLARGRRGVKRVAAAQADDVAALRTDVDSALRGRDYVKSDLLATRLLEAYATAGDYAGASALITRVTRSGEPRRFLARAAALREREGNRGEAIELLEKLVVLESGTANAVPALFKLATLRRGGGDRDGARHALERALGQPNCSAEWHRRIDNAMTALAE
ncbi:MAG TPA: rhomboid family intramembrane serine protease [Thermoanaerobaculia bacterium]|nr:rhomboid family intramembrane serine protease [Thermoanaerobaculia bacterium]